MTTIGSVLYPDRSDGEADVRKLLEPGGPAADVGAEAARLGPTGGAVVAAQVFRAVAELLDVGVPDVVLGGLQRYEDVIDAARETAANARMDRTLEWETLLFSSTQRPTVDVVVDGRKIHVFQLDIKVVGTLYALMITVSAGRITKVHGGRAEVVVSLAMDGVELRSRKISTPVALTVDVDITIPLSGVP